MDGLVCLDGNHPNKPWRQAGHVEKNACPPCDQRRNEQKSILGKNIRKQKHSERKRGEKAEIDPGPIEAEPAGSAFKLGPSRHQVVATNST
jgi:hypothetical protein